ncbi:dimethylsulfonioproprionate lyase family protein [Sulfitobacter aestuarii]|uniref:Dimethylsulfonioproprionate lyase family protein n=1 Tax=Sulfitobacter aestuarii TaxID=2161676 RepID=A0ABW5U5R7_9RHOB
MMRPGHLQDFLDALLAATRARVISPEAAASLERIAGALERPAPPAEADGSRLPVCALLEEMLDPIRFDAPDLRALAASFSRLEPALTWRRRAGSMRNASAGIDERHANAMIVGPAGHEPRRDVWIGASLLAPEVRYPDHDHPPEETYLVLSDGDFLQGDGPWFTPGIGGTLYNPPGINHAMRTGETPLLAFWMLCAERPES